jgi:hypothetical protein
VLFPRADQSAPRSQGAGPNETLHFVSPPLAFAAENGSPSPLCVLFSARTTPTGGCSYRGTHFVVGSRGDPKINLRCLAWPGLEEEESQLTDRLQLISQTLRLRCTAFASTIPASRRGKYSVQFDRTTPCLVKLLHYASLIPLSPC